MEELKMFYHVSKKTVLGYVDSVQYGDKVLATFNKETDFIDLSVLNPFVNKEVKFITIDIDTKIATVSKKLIHRVETKDDGQIMIHLEDFEEEEDIDV